MKGLREEYRRLEELTTQQNEVQHRDSKGSMITNTRTPLLIDFDEPDSSPPFHASTSASILDVKPNTEKVRSSADYLRAKPKRVTKTSSLNTESSDITSSLSSGTDMTDASSELLPDGFRMKAMSNYKVGLKRNYVATAFSATCKTIAVLDRSSFFVYTLPDLGKPELRCTGSHDAKYGQNLKSMIFRTSRNMKPVYHRAVVSDELLCIAGMDSYVDIHDVASGKQIGLVVLPAKLRCWTMSLSPVGRTLAIGTDTGEILVYKLGSENFNTVRPEQFQGAERRSINCIAFSPNSLYMSTCASDNVIRTFNLEEGTLLSKFDRKLDAEACKAPYYGVTGLALYLNS